MPSRVLFEENVAGTVGDFVLRRGDGIFAYQLAVTVDNLAMRISEVVRGADLLASAPRQALLAELLGGTKPAFAHIPLATAEDGARLAKRAAGVAVRDYREAGVAPARVVGLVAAALGLVPVAQEGREFAMSVRDVLARFDRTVMAGRKTVPLPRLSLPSAC